MNQKQKVILFLGLMLIIVMGLYPPYNVHSLSGNPTQYVGYGFLLDPPKINEYWVAKVNIKRLINQWLIVFVSASLLYFAFKEKKNS